MEDFIGMWSTNNGNTWGEAITGKTVLGLKRKLNNIIRGNLTGINDIGKGTIIYAETGCEQAVWTIDWFDHIVHDI